MSTLSIYNLSKTISSRKILDNISLSVKTGEVVALLGPNGAGKTTLLKSIIGLYPLSQSKNSNNCIKINKEIINTWSISKRVRNGLQYLPQNSSLFQSMSVKKNLDLVYEYDSYWHNKTYNVFLEERNTWLKQTSLQTTLKQEAKTLSGGQKRKLEVVRALLMHPQIILFDEPFAGVDPKSIYEIKTIFQQMSQRNIGIVISDHHVDQLLSIATKGYVIVQGKIITSGSIRDILNCSYTKENYLGNQFYQEITEKLQTQESLQNKS